MEPGTLWYAKAQYWLGAAAVQDEDLERALGHFQVAAGTSTETEAGREVVDLAHLAIARIQYEQGNLLEAVESYTTVSGDSLHLPDKLYELIWTAIRRASWDEALDGIDIFLAYPEHAYVGSLRSRANLHADRDQRGGLSPSGVLGGAGDARGHRTRLRCRERFGLLAESDAPGEGIRQLMLLRTPRAKSSGFAGYALAMMRQDPSWPGD